MPDLRVMLADGGECVTDLGAVRERATLFGPAASDSTAFRTIQKIASTPGCWTRSAPRAPPPERFLERHRAPGRLTIDVDATLITSHSEKENAAGSCKHGYGFHPLGIYGDETWEGLAIAVASWQRRREHAGDRPPRASSRLPSGRSSR